MPMSYLLTGYFDTSSCSLHPILHVIISWINLDFGIEVCFYSGMNVYQKTWLLFVFPICIWFLVGGIIVVCCYSSTVMKLMSMRNIEVLATLFLLSYAKLVKTIVTVFSVTSLANASSMSDQLHPHRGSMMVELITWAPNTCLYLWWLFYFSSCHFFAVHSDSSFWTMAAACTKEGSSGCKAHSFEPPWMAITLLTPNPIATGQG